MRWMEVDRRRTGIKDGRKQCVEVGVGADECRELRLQ